MPDTTIASSSKKLTSDWDDAPIPYAGPPPKKTTSSTSSSSDATYGSTGPSAYDVKDVAKYMPVTPMTTSSTPSTPSAMTLTLEAQKAAVDKRLASPVDYPQRKYDEGLRDDLARRIADRDAQTKVAAKEAQCPSWAACQPVPKGYDPNQGGTVVAKPSPGETTTVAKEAVVFGGRDSSLRLGYVDATTVPDSATGQQRVDQVGIGVVKGQRQETLGYGVTRTTTITGGAVFAQTGPTNPDGSKGIGFDAGATLLGGEETFEARNGAGATVGVSAGVSAGGTVGVRDAKDGGKAACGRAELGPVTVGGCVPLPGDHR